MVFMRATLSSFNIQFCSFGNFGHNRPLSSVCEFNFIFCRSFDYPNAFLASDSLSYSLHPQKLGGFPYFAGE